MSARAQTDWARSGGSSPTLLGRSVVAAVAISGLLFTWAAERGSPQRANRLHREGALSEAAAIYARHVTEGDVDPSLRYNLGTSLLGLGSSGARAELEAVATADVVPELRASALYNHGVSSLRRALGEADDSTRWYAAAAVAANRGALRLRPDHADTKWNLAIAQRMLDSIDAEDRRSGRELDEGAVEADLVVRSQNARDVEADDELPEEAPREGEEETRVEVPGEGSLSLTEAEEILGTSHLDARLIVQKLLVLEGRSAWGFRLRRTVGPRR